VIIGEPHDREGHRGMGRFEDPTRVRATTEAKARARAVRGLAEREREGEREQYCDVVAIVFSAVPSAVSIPK
jgi:hypothetical protein